MGTRGLVGWKVNGEYHGTYNHWDSYPEGLGMKVAKWISEKLKTEEDVKNLKDNLQKVVFIDPKTPAPLELQEKYKKFSDCSVSEQKLEDWYCLFRKLQGTGYLDAIFSGELEHVNDNISFITDSLFCEHAYIIDLDEKMFEYYKGFNKNPIENDPFKHLKKEYCEYYSCALVWKCSLQESLNSMTKHIKDMKEGS